jgi:Nucleotidyl transferase AbiEii toxin, Type IV TA system
MNTDAIKHRLTAMATQEKIVVLYERYFQERFLFRLSLTPYREHFFLKGGTLLYAWQGRLARPTRDIDLLGIDISGNFEQIQQVFKGSGSSSVMKRVKTIFVVGSSVDA